MIDKKTRFVIKSMCNLEIIKRNKGLVITNADPVLIPNDAQSEKTEEIVSHARRIIEEWLLENSPEEFTSEIKEELFSYVINRLEEENIESSSL